MMMKDRYLSHHGIKGQRWGIRRFQNSDGSLTPAGRNRYLDKWGSLNEEGRRAKKDVSNRVSKAMKESGASSVIKKSNEFQGKYDEVEDEYITYFDSLKKSSSFRQKVYADVDRNLSVKSSSRDLRYQLEDSVSKLARESEPPKLKSKLEEFRRTGDEYFSQIESLSKRVMSEVGLDRDLDEATRLDQSVPGKGKNYVDRLVHENPRLSFRMNSYIYNNVDGEMYESDFFYDLVDSLENSYGSSKRKW